MNPSRLRTRLSNVAILLMLLLCAGCGSPFFHPDKTVVVPPFLDRVVREEVAFTAGDGVKLHGWLLSPKGGPPPRGTILFLHGNAGNIGTHVGAVAWIAESGYRVFTFDYRGYGQSEGTPTADGVHEDARAALALLPTLPGVDRNRIAVLGQSLGGSIAVYTVAHAPDKSLVKALVIEGAFAGWRRIVRDKLASTVIGWPLAYPASWCFDDRYSAERWIGGIAPIPVAIIHGTADAVVPYRHGEILYGKAMNPKGFWTVRDGGHVRAFAEEGVRRQFIEFLDAWVAQGKPPAAGR